MEMPLVMQVWFCHTSKCLANEKFDLIMVPDEMPVHSVVVKSPNANLSIVRKEKSKDPLNKIWCLSRQSWDISQNRWNLWPAGGVTRKVGCEGCLGSSKSTGFIIWTPWVSVTHFMEMRPTEQPHGVLRVKSGNHQRSLRFIHWRAWISAPNVTIINNYNTCNRAAATWLEGNDQ